MQTNVQTTHQPPERASRRAKPSIPLFLALWMLLIASGVVGTIWYTGKLKDNMTKEIGAQTARQIQSMQQDYEAQIKQLQDKFSGDLNKMQSKVDALNELFEFTKDSTSTKTDNSNKLYTQLSDVKKKLAQLQQGLDVLK